MYIFNNFHLNDGSDFITLDFSPNGCSLSHKPGSNSTNRWESRVVLDQIFSTITSLSLAHSPAARRTLSVPLSLWKLTMPKNMIKGYKNKTTIRERGDKFTLRLSIMAEQILYDTNYIYFLKQ